MQPTNSQKAILKAKQKTDFKPNVFAFPKDPVVRQKWLDVIRRDDANWNPDHAGVCELHFSENDYITDTAGLKNVERKRRKLKSGVVPSKFQCYPSRARPKIPTQRPSENATTNVRFNRAQVLLDRQIASFQVADKFDNLQDLYQKLQFEKIPSGFR